MRHATCGTWAVLAAAACLWVVPVSGIIGGHGTTIDKFPYQVAIEITTGDDCVGTIISDQWVLSTAFCLSRAHGDVKTINVRAGSTQRHMGGELLHVASLNNHPDYDGKGKAKKNDAALIKLSAKIDLTKLGLSAATLPESGAEDPNWSRKLIVTGWGSTDDDETYPDVLMAARIPAVPRHTCEMVYANEDFTSTMLCAGVSGKDWCGNERGAPLVAEDTRVVVGIASWHVGAFCDNPGFPRVYTKIGDKLIRDWIKKTTGV